MWAEREHAEGRHQHTPYAGTKQPQQLRLRHLAALQGLFQLRVTFAASQEPCR